MNNTAHSSAEIVSCYSSPHSWSSVSARALRVNWLIG